MGLDSWLLCALKHSYLPKQVPPFRGLFTMCLWKRPSSGASAEMSLWECVWEGGAWRYFFSALTQYFSTLSLSSFPLSFPLAPRSMKLWGPFLGVPQQWQNCPCLTDQSDPPDPCLELFHGEKWGSGRVRAFSRLASCLYYRTKWWKAWPWPSIWHFVLTGHLTLAAQSSAQLSSWHYFIDVEMEAVRP